MTNNAFIIPAYQIFDDIKRRHGEASLLPISSTSLTQARGRGEPSSRHRTSQNIPLYQSRRPRRDEFASPTLSPAIQPMPPLNNTSPAPLLSSQISHHEVRYPDSHQYRQYAPWDEAFGVHNIKRSYPEQTVQPSVASFQTWRNEIGSHTAVAYDPWHAQEVRPEQPLHAIPALNDWSSSNYGEAFNDQGYGSEQRSLQVGSRYVEMINSSQATGREPAENHHIV